MICLSYGSEVSSSTFTFTTSEGPESSSIPAFTFFTSEMEVLRFEQDGRVFVRGELVESNPAVLDALKYWLCESLKTPERTEQLIKALEPPSEPGPTVWERLNALD